MNHVLIKSSHTSLRVIHLTTKVTSVLTLYVNASRGSKNKKYPFIRNPRIFPTTSSSACEIHKIVMIFIGGSSSSLSPIGNGSVSELLGNRLPSFLLHPLLHWPRCYAAQCLTQCPQAYKFGLFHPYCICFVYATSLSRRNPSFRMLMAAFWSRSICKPQSQSITRILRSFISGCWLPHL